MTPPFSSERAKGELGIPRYWILVPPLPFEEVNWASRPNQRMAPLSLSDLNGSDTTEAQTETESESREEVPSVMLQFTADEERIRNVRDFHSEEAFENMVEYAEKVAENPELAQLAEEYRMYDDMKRIRYKLYQFDASYETWLANFWYGKLDGDSDDFTRDSYNGAQEAARDEGVNLYYHRMIAPTPIEEAWPGDEVVTWKEFESHGFADDEQDSDIFVTREWAEEHMQFAREVDGESRPLPPSDEQLAELDTSDDSSGSSQSELPLDPSEYTISELKDALREVAPDVPGETSGIKQAEKQDKNRKGAKKAIDRYEKKRLDSDESDDSDEETITVTIDGKEVTGSPEHIEQFLD